MLRLWGGLVSLTLAAGCTMGGAQVGADASGPPNAIQHQTDSGGASRDASAMGHDASPPRTDAAIADSAIDDATPDAGTMHDASGPDAWVADGAIGDAHTATDASLDAGGLDAPIPADAASDDAGLTADSGIHLDAGVQCEVTVCLTGAVAHSDGSNGHFRTLCELPAVLGRVENCRTQPCESTWTNFPNTEVTTGSNSYQALFNALDSNADNLIDHLDTPCQLNVLGFSWGGVNASRLASTFLTDARVAPQRRRVERLILLAPYQPLVFNVEIPSGVENTWVYRHSATPSFGDCSSSAVLGPYLGVPPRCAVGQACADYDYSLAPNTWFQGLVYGSYGSDVGHCDLPNIATPAVLANLTDTPAPQLPPTRPVSAP
jgi:hypothetical protein